MVDIPERDERNKLRSVVTNAQNREAITREEAGFVIMLIERFRADIDKKIKEMHVMQGQINQLKNNEQVIIQLIENITAAAERDLARRETMSKLKDAREVELERHLERAARNQGAVIEEDLVKDNVDDSKAGN